MKKIVILLSLAASFAMFAGCASKSTGEASMSAAPAAPAHYDYKGEK